MRGRWWFAATRPQGRPPGHWVLPKGLVDSGESTRDAAAREVLEETGLSVELIEKLGDVRYTYTWEGERIFKIVSFYLMRPTGGRIGLIEPEMRIEVAEARWRLLEDAESVLAYKGEREMAIQARAWTRKLPTDDRNAR